MHPKTLVSVTKYEQVKSLLLLPLSIFAYPGARSPALLLMHLLVSDSLRLSATTTTFCNLYDRQQTDWARRLLLAGCRRLPVSVSVGRRINIIIQSTSTVPLCSYLNQPTNQPTHPIIISLWPGSWTCSQSTSSSSSSSSTTFESTYTRVLHVSELVNK